MVLNETSADIVTESMESNEIALEPVDGNNKQNDEQHGTSASRLQTHDTPHGTTTPLLVVIASLVLIVGALLIVVYMMNEKIKSISDLGSPKVSFVYRPGEARHQTNRLLVSDDDATYDDTRQSSRSHRLRPGSDLASLI